MTVYMIKNDNYKYQELTLGIDDFIDQVPEEYSALQISKFSYHNLSMSDWWKGIRSSFKTIEGEPVAPIPDISLWKNTSLVLSTKAYEVLVNVLSPFGEFLPVECEEGLFYIFNCLTIGLVDEINSEQDIQDGAFMGVKHLTFNRVDIAEKKIFKTQFNRCLDIYCQDDLKSTILDNDLKGVVFKEDLTSPY